MSDLQLAQDASEIADKKLTSSLASVSLPVARQGEQGSKPPKRTQY